MTAAGHSGTHYRTLLLIKSGFSSFMRPRASVRSGLKVKQLWFPTESNRLRQQNSSSWEGGREGGRRTKLIFCFHSTITVSKASDLLLLWLAVDAVYEPSVMCISNETCCISTTAESRARKPKRRRLISSNCCIRLPQRATTIGCQQSSQLTRHRYSRVTEDFLTFILVKLCFSFLLKSHSSSKLVISNILRAANPAKQRREFNLEAFRGERKRYTVRWQHIWRVTKRFHLNYLGL